MILTMIFLSVRYRWSHFLAALMIIGGIVIAVYPNIASIEPDALLSVIVLLVAPLPQAIVLVYLEHNFQKMVKHSQKPFLFRDQAPNRTKNLKSSENKPQKRIWISTTHLVGLTFSNFYLASLWSSHWFHSEAYRWTNFGEMLLTATHVYSLVQILNPKMIAAQQDFGI